MEDLSLISAAWAARQHAYAPYSKFAVGAAVLTDDGRVITGANVENLSFGLTICAERVAIAAAVTAGARRIPRVAVVADSACPVSPCGACRQVMAEFGVEEVVIANRSETLVFQLSELLPRASEGILG